MPKDKLTDYSATNASNTDVGGVNIDEGMLPSAVNNAIREQMTHLKDFADGTTGIDVLNLQDDDASASIKLQAPASVTSDTTLTLPDGDGDSGQTLVTNGSGTLAWAAPYGNRNLIINGAMQVAQRATSATAVSGAGVYDTIDRLKLWNSSNGAFTSEQSTVVPSGQGFNNSVKFQVTTADSSIAANQYATFGQIIEAQDCQRLSFGTSAAKTVTVSFWVRSNKTGIYCLAFDKEDSPSTSFVKEFTISSADTWERKEIVVTPDSQIKGSNGAIANDNGRGIRVFIGLAWGTDYHRTDGTWGTGTGRFATSNQVNWLDSTSNNFYLTGFQVEVGTATPFEHEPYSVTLQKAQRYCQVRSSEGVNYGVFAGGGLVASNVAYFTIPHITTMRAAPSNSITGTFRVDGGNNAHTSFTFDRQTTHSFRAIVATSSITTSVAQLQADATNTSTIISDAEL